MRGRLDTRICERDSDYARLAKFYMAESYQFDRHMTLLDHVAHLMMTLHNSRFMLYENHEAELVAYLQYRYQDDGAMVFIESAILAEPYRGSWIFYRGFGDWVKTVARENERVSLVRFHVLQEQTYLNRLYAKFARFLGEREGSNGREFAYETTFAELRSYLKVDG